MYEYLTTEDKIFDTNTTQISHVKRWQTFTITTEQKTINALENKLLALHFMMALNKVLRIWAIFAKVHAREI